MGYRCTVLLLCCTALWACTMSPPESAATTGAADATTVAPAPTPTIRPAGQATTVAPAPTATVRPAGQVAVQSPPPTNSEPTAATTTSDNLAPEGVTIRADGVLLVAGQPFFPFGFALYPRYGSEEFRPETLEAIAASGFNTLHAPIRDNYRDLQADADRLGMRLIAEIYPYELDDAGIVTAIDWVKDHPGLLAYAIADDVDDGDYYSPENVAQINQLVKSVDRNHPTYISGFVPEQISAFMQSADIVAMQSYPIGKLYWKHALPSHVNYAISTAMAAAQPVNRPIIANLQAFTWPDQREPTAVEIRNMTYQALINNVRGIIYYAYNDGVWRIERHPSVLQAIQELVPEIQRLTPAMLDGAYSPLRTSDQDTLAAEWRHENKLYVMVVNTVEQASSVSVTVPGPVYGEAEPLFVERPAGMEFKNGQLSGDLEPLGVRVYVFSTTP